MKKLLSSLAACAAVFCAADASANAYWTVSDAHAKVVLPTSVFTDSQGVSGQVGRQVRVSDISLEFNRDLGGRLFREDQEYEPGEFYSSYSLLVGFTLSYNLSDANTGELLADIREGVKWYLGGGGAPQPDPLSFGFYDFGGSSLSSISGGERTYLAGTGRYCDNYRVTGGLLTDDGNGACGSGYYEFTIAPGISSEGAYAIFEASAQLVPVSVPVPEPETYALTAAGLAMVALARRRKTGV